MRNAIGTLFYVASGFFFYTVALLAFINEPPVSAKLAIMGGVIVPALGFLVGGLRISRTQNQKRHIGVVMLCGALATSFVVLTFACIMATPEFQQNFPTHKLAFFSDYLSGGGTIAAIGILGAFLIWRSHKPKAA